MQAITPDGRARHPQRRLRRDFRYNGTPITAEKVAQLFNMTTDQIINYDGKMPKEVVIEDKTAVEQMRLIQQIDEEDKQTIFKLIDKMLTNKKFKDFFAKNVAML